MGFISSTRKHNTSMGLLLVFFPEDHNKGTNPVLDREVAAAGNFSSSSPTTARVIRRTNSSSLLFTKAQSTISICVFLVFVTLLVFTLSTFEPAIPIPTTVSASTSRRFLTQKFLLTKPDSPSFSSFWVSKLSRVKFRTTPYVKKQSSWISSFALQGMGTLFRRGTRAMNNLVVTHVSEDVTEDELRLFLRSLHRSGVTAKSDVVFIFGSSSSAKFYSVVQEENDSFLELLDRHKKSVNSTRDSVFSFDVTHFVKSGKKDVGEPLWGKKIRGNYSDFSKGETELTRLSYGSVLGFETNELDPENSLSGFLGHVPTSLRRWACYPMLLGRVRRNFKHIMLVDVKNMVITGDPLGRVKNGSPESVYLLAAKRGGNKHNKKNPEKTQSNYSVNSAILMGGTRGIRRLSLAMLTEIVRAAIQHKKKNSFSESGILSQLVGNQHLLKNVNVVRAAESIPDASSLTVSRSKSSMDYSIIQRGNSNGDEINSMIKKQICSCEVDSSSVYRDC
ncbi:hypothetical protein SLE2022_062370 [Rubroshorea leprosula]